MLVLALSGAMVGLAFSWSSGRELPGEHALVAAIAVIIVYPVLEEFAFRGSIQGFLLRRFSGVIGPFSHANLITSAVFAAAHYFILPHPMTWLVFIPSLAFGWTRDRHQVLTGCVGLHILWNAAFVAGTVI